jgi:hypothetical protein
MESHLRSVPERSKSWQARLWEAAFKDLPDDLSDAQWTALVELIDLVQDEDFGRRLSEQGRSYWTKARPGDASVRPRLGLLIRIAARAADRRQPTTGPRARRLAGRFVSFSARAAGLKPTRAFARWQLAQRALHDPRSERFWTLVAVVRGWPSTPRPEVRAYTWLFDALDAALRAKRRTFSNS